MMTRRSSASSQRSKPLFAIGAAVAVLVGLWLAWPSGRVKNRDSRGTNIIAFGDSLTAGHGAREGEDYPSRLGARIGREVINTGASGDTTAMALSRIERDVLSLDPKLVIVGLGGNDFLQSVPLTTTEANLRTIVRRIQERGAMVILLGYRFPSLQNNYEKMYERIASEEECLLVPDLLDGILTDPSLKSDEIHPNARGYAILAERVEPAVNKLIK
jgi:acyl-CoA thioesterase-1